MPEGSLKSLLATETFAILQGLEEQLPAPIVQGRAARLFGGSLPSRNPGLSPRGLRRGTLQSVRGFPGACAPGLMTGGGSPPRRASLCRGFKGAYESVHTGVLPTAHAYVTCTPGTLTITTKVRIRILQDWLDQRLHREEEGKPRVSPQIAVRGFHTARPRGASCGVNEALGHQPILPAFTMLHPGAERPIRKDRSIKTHHNLWTHVTTSITRTVELVVG